MSAPRQVGLSPGKWPCKADAWGQHTLKVQNCELIPVTSLLSSWCPGITKKIEIFYCRICSTNLNSTKIQRTPETHQTSSNRIHIGMLWGDAYEMPPPVTLQHLFSTIAKDKWNLAPENDLKLLDLLAMFFMLLLFLNSSLCFFSYLLCRCWCSLRWWLRDA